MSALLSIRLESVDYPRHPGVLRDLRLDVEAGETVALIGQSGSGKSTLSLAVLRLLDWKRGKVQGQILWKGRDLLQLSEREMRAMKAGAIDFLTKPARDEDLLAAIDRARRIDAEMRRSSAEIAAVKDRMAKLTPREHEVLGHVLKGRLNKQIAGDLGTVEQTIKVHRRRMMEKLSVRSLLELERMMQKASSVQSPEGSPPPFRLPKESR